jgi:di/tricarboxylate transporter
MSTTSVLEPQSSRAAVPPRGWWRIVVPVAIAVALALAPSPPGLSQHAWYYFALFSGVVAVLVTEPIPNTAVGMVGLMLAAGLAIPGLSPMKLALGLAMTTGLIGILTPYATGAALPYYNSGYLTPAQFWRLGGIFGLIFLVALLGVGVPLLPG